MFYARKETADEQDDVILNKPLIELKWYGGTSNMHKVVLFFFLHQRLQPFTDGPLKMQVIWILADHFFHISMLEPLNWSA